MIIKIPGFDIKNEIYQNSKAIYYRAVAQKRKEQVILKTLRSDFPDVAEIGRLRHEFELATKLDHPGIEKYLSFGHSGDRYYIEMEYFSSIPLSNYLSSRTIHLKDILYLALQWVDILSEIHHHELIHKNLHPGMILVNPLTQQIRLFDFSLASSLKHERQLTILPQVLEGQLTYISPEQTGRMNRDLDYRTDYYSLGISLYELLAGYPPFVSDDPLELVHAHIARQPEPLLLKNPDVPPVLSDIILKLLAKIPEERYQSTHGLKEDLQQCLDQLEENGKIEAFPIGTHDFSDQFQIPATLYGRESEIEELVSTFFEMAADGDLKTIWVTGEAGVGKTVYVKEVLKQLSHARGYFISGKFDLLGRTTLFEGFIQAFNDLMQQIVATSQNELETWRSKILDALGSNGKILTDLVQGLEWVIGPQPDPPPLQGEEAMRRFEQVFLSFLKIIASAQHPLVLFLDDLQWADSGSLRLMELMLLEPDIQYLLFIGSYRPNEVNELHPLLWTRKKIASNEVHDIALEPLNAEHLKLIVADTLKVHKQEVVALSELVFTKTQGNPFFTNQFLLSLHEAQLIHFDKNSQQWKWDLEEIRKRDITDNVVALLIEKINRLPVPTRRLLQVAACIGSVFEMETLYQLTGKENLSHLWKALIEGLIMPLDENYRMLLAFERDEIRQNGSRDFKYAAAFQFLHDRVQQAAYTMMPTPEKEAVHLKIGRMLLEQYEELERPEAIYEICNHLNISKSLIDDGDEKKQLSELNWAAAVRARTANAYDTALRYLDEGIELLPTQHWTAEHTLSMHLFTEKAICLYLQGNTPAADQLLQILPQKANSKLEKLGIYLAHVNLLTQAESHAEVLRIGRRALRLFNIRISNTKRNLQLGIFKELIIARLRLIGKQPEALIDHKFIQDQERIKVLEFIVSMVPSAFQTNQDIFAFLILKILNITLKFGNNEASPLSYIGYSIILNSAFHDYTAALKFGDLALNLNERLNNPIPTSSLLYPYHNFVVYPKKEIRSQHHIWKELFQLSLEQGDPHYAGYALVTEVWNGCTLGIPLEQLLETGDTALEFLYANNDLNSVDMLLSRYQAILLLIGKPLCAWRDDDTQQWDLLQKFDALIAEGVYTSVATLLISLLQVNYLLPKDNAIKWISRSEKYVSYLGGLYVFIDFALYQCLLISRVYHRSSRRQKFRFRTLVGRRQKVLKKLSASCPSNHIAHYLIIDAVHTWLLGSEKDAIDKMQAAADFADQNQFVQIKAHAHEWLGNYHYTKNNPKVARMYLQEALHGYAIWGASAKVEQLQAEYEDLGLQGPTGRKQVAGKRNLDVSTLVKASLSISEEIILDRLLEKMMRIVLENAGAEKGFFVDYAQDELSIKAAESIRGESIDHQMAESIVRYVWHSGEAIVIHDAGREQQFASDPYIQKQQPKSILCTPIRTHGKLLGALYLENNLTTHAFTPERLETLRILSSQIAISLENATLYKDLNDALERQRALTDAYSRFTPKEFLDLLGKHSILDVTLGDRRQGTMSVLFSDIRSYTSLVEKMTLEDNFEFVNSYANKMTKVISGNNGVVNQFLGDGIMAFFGNSDDALNACLSMQKELNIYNGDRVAKGRQPIDVGIGVHTGSLIIGIIGTQNRMDQAMISDTVNTAARIEGLTKYFYARLVVSQQVLNNLENKHHYHYRYLGKVMVKGKEEVLDIYDVFSVDPPDTFDKKLATQHNFEVALGHYMKKDFPSAILHFEQVLQKFPEDSTSQRYLEQSKLLLMNPPVPDWDGSIKMELK